MESRVCSNCSAQVNGNYCSHCGQKILRVPYTFSFIKDSIGGVFDFDKGFFQTFRQLMVNPFLVVSQYLIGNSKKFSNPLKYLLTGMSLYLILQLIYLRIIPNFKPDTEAKAYLIALLFCVTAWIWNYVLLRTSKNIIEHLIISVYQASQFILIGTALDLGFGILYSMTLVFQSDRDLLAITIIVSIFVYYVFFTKNVFRLSWFKASWLTISYFILTSLIMVAYTKVLNRIF